MAVDLFKPPLCKDGKDWIRQLIGKRVVYLDVAIQYHLKHQNATEPVAGYHSLFGCSRDSIEVRRIELEEAITYPTPQDALWLLGHTDPWTTEVNERIQSLRTQIVLLTAAGQL